MKALTFLFALVFLFALTSCGGAGKLPTDNITIGQAFNHVAQSTGYWFWIVFIGIITVVAGYFLIKKYNDLDIEGGQFALYAVLLIAVNLFTWLFRVCEVATNTTVEQAARGGWIGY